MGEALFRPGQGNGREDGAGCGEELLEDRMERLGEVREALRALGRAATLEAITARIYADVPEHVLPAARSSVGAQLAYLGF